jgi:hypothetical protein
MKPENRQRRAATRGNMVPWSEAECVRDIMVGGLFFAPL